jgi:predicted aldo/keto reductase-like oxidoreductase
MRYRRFGRTELQMPVFSCGGMRYQHSWKDQPLSEVSAESQQNLQAILDHALNAGINHIETARFYGTSEIQLGLILPKLNRDQLIVQTKIVPTEDPSEFLNNFHRSLEHLQLDYVDLFSIHGINTPELLDYTLRPGGCLDQAKQLQQQGRARFIGFSTHAPTDVIIQAIRSDQFDYVNLHWYYIFQDNWPAIEAANQQDMGVFIISPTDKGGHLYSPPQILEELCQPLHPIVFNNLFCLSHPQVHTLSIGAARPSDFDLHLQTLEVLDSADVLLPEILDRLKQRAIARLGEAWYRHWKSGLPRPSETPGNFNIPVMLWLYNLVKAYDMLEFAKARYNLLGNGGHWFPGSPFDPQQSHDLPACLEQSSFADRIPELLAEVHGWLKSETVQRLSQSS